MSGRLRIRDGAGVMREIKQIHVRDSNNQAIEIKRIRVKDGGGVLRTVFAGLGITVSPNPVDGLGTSGATADVTTAATVVTATGFVSPTYSWALKGTSPYAWTITAPTAATTAFTAAAVPNAAYATAVFTVTVTDSDGSKLFADVTAEARNNYTIGTGAGSGSTSGSAPSGGTGAGAGGYTGPRPAIP